LSKPWTYEGRILVGEIAAPEPAPDGGRISARDPADGQTDLARDLPAQDDPQHAHEQHGHHHEEGGRELLGIATHGLMSHAVVGGVVESLASFFLDHGAGAAAEAVREIGEAVEHIGEAREGFEAVKVVTSKGHDAGDAGGGRHRIPHEGKAHEVNPTAPAQAAQEQQAKENQQVAHDRELAAFLKQRAAERQQFEKDDDFGLDL
jgi:hypothetical protein